MSKEEKKIASALTAAFKALPESKKEFLLGYAEGVAAMAKQEPADVDPQRKEG